MSDKSHKSTSFKKMIKSSSKGLKKISKQLFTSLGKKEEKANTKEENVVESKQLENKTSSNSFLEWSYIKSALNMSKIDSDAERTFEEQCDSSSNASFNEEGFGQNSDEDKAQQDSKDVTEDCKIVDLESGENITEEASSENKKVEETMPELDLKDTPITTNEEYWWDESFCKELVRKPQYIPPATPLKYAKAVQCLSEEKICSYCDGKGKGGSDKVETFTKNPIRMPIKRNSLETKNEESQNVVDLNESLNVSVSSVKSRIPIFKETKNEESQNVVELNESLNVSVSSVKSRIPIFKETKNEESQNVVELNESLNVSVSSVKSRIPIFKDIIRPKLKSLTKWKSENSVQTSKIPKSTHNISNQSLQVPQTSSKVPIFKNPPPPAAVKSKIPKTQSPEMNVSCTSKKPEKSCKMPRSTRPATPRDCAKSSGSTSSRDLQTAKPPVKRGQIKGKGTSSLPSSKLPVFSMQKKPSKSVQVEEDNWSVSSCASNRTYIKEGRSLIKSISQYNLAFVDESELIGQDSQEGVIGDRISSASYTICAAKRGETYGDFETLSNHSNVSNRTYYIGEGDVSILRNHVED